MKAVTPTGDKNFISKHLKIDFKVAILGSRAVVDQFLKKSASSIVTFWGTMKFFLILQHISFIRAFLKLLYYFFNFHILTQSL